MTQLNFFDVLETTIDKWALTWEELMNLPDTPDITARRNKRETSMWFLLGKRGVSAS